MPLTAKDFRYGNWAINELDPKYAPQQIIVIEEKRVELKYGDKVFYEDLLPVPLTKIILVQLGFNKHYKDDAFIYDGWFRIEHNHLFGGYTYNLKNAQAPIVLYYVHQLQNLIFSLSGKELEINF